MGIIERTKASLERTFNRNGELVRDITVTSSKNVPGYVVGTGMAPTKNIWTTDGILMKPRSYKREQYGSSERMRVEEQLLYVRDDAIPDGQRFYIEDVVTVRDESLEVLMIERDPTEQLVYLTLIRSNS